MLSPVDLRNMVEQVGEAAEAAGLPLSPVHFELVEGSAINILAAYGGIPVRYAYWGFGKTWGRLKMATEFRQSQIYEMVINHNPAYAFLDRAMDPSRALLVIAHVLAHVHFFRHNRLFRHSRPDALAMMSRHRRLVARLRAVHGEPSVERLMDALLILSDFTGDSVEPAPAGTQASDILGYLGVHSPVLESWERELLLAIHAESRYFWPQILTKILNEGYASFWHRRIMRRMAVGARSSWEIAKMHAELVAEMPKQLNPYAMGLGLLGEAHRQGGLDGIFKAAAELDDIGLLRAFLTEELCRQWHLAFFSNREDRRAEEQSFAAIKSGLIRDVEHGGIPHIQVNRDMTADGEGTLYLRHLHDGRDLDFSELPKALQPVAERLWGGRVLLTTIHQKLPRVVYHDGREWSEQIHNPDLTNGTATDTAKSN